MKVDTRNIAQEKETKHESKMDYRAVLKQPRKEKFFMNAGSLIRKLRKETASIIKGLKAPKPEEDEDCKPIKKRASRSASPGTARKSNTTKRKSTKTA